MILAVQFNGDVISCDDFSFEESNWFGCRYGHSVQGFLGEGEVILGALLYNLN